MDHETELAKTMNFESSEGTFMEPVFSQQDSECEQMLNMNSSIISYARDSKIAFCK